MRKSNKVALTFESFDEILDSGGVIIQKKHLWENQLCHYTICLPAFCKGKVLCNFDFATSGTDRFPALAFIFIADWNNTPSKIMHAPSLSSFMFHLSDHEFKFYIRCNLRVRSMQFNYY